MAKTPFTRERHHPFCQTSFPRSLIRSQHDPPPPTRTTAKQVLGEEEDFARRRFREKKISRKEDFAKRRFREKKISRERNFARKKFREKILETGIDWMMIQFSRVINQTRFRPSNYLRKQSFSRSRSFTNNLFFDCVRACARIKSLSVGVRTP